MSPTLRRRSGRLNIGRHVSQTNHEDKRPYQAPKTPPSMQRYTTAFKRRRISASQGSSPSKAPKQGDQDGIEFDSEGFEIVEPVIFPTPSTVEIFNSSDTERGPKSDPADLGDVEESDCSDHPQSPNTSGSRVAAEFRSPGFSEAKANPAGPFTPNSHGSPSRPNDDFSQCYSEPLLKPDPSGDDVPDLSPNTYIYVRNLGLHSPDGSFFEHWANYPVSFIPSAFPLGPRDLDIGHYNCPYPGCIDAFGPSGQSDGYTGRGLVLHIYQRHGHGPAVDRVRLDLHMRVTTLRNVNGKESVDALLPCYWNNPGRDLNRVTAGLIEDLDEIRRWERSRGVVIPKYATPGRQESAGAVNEGERKGKRKAMSLRGESSDLWDRTDSLDSGYHRDLETEAEVDGGSPSIRARTKFFARSRDNRFQRPREASLLHLKELCRTPKKKSDEQDSSSNMEFL